MADEAKAVDSIQSDIAESKATNPIEGGVPNTDDLEKRIQSAVDKTASKIKKEYEDFLDTENKVEKEKPVPYEQIVQRVQNMEEFPTLDEPQDTTQ